MSRPAKRKRARKLCLWIARDQGGCVYIYSYRPRWFKPRVSEGENSWPGWWVDWRGIKRHADCNAAHRMVKPGECKRLEIVDDE